MTTLTPSKQPLLEVNEVTLQFGGLTAVNSVSFAVNQGEIVSIIGPNGAGKTSLFNAITGVFNPTSGKINILGEDTSRRFDRTAIFFLILTSVSTAFLLGLAWNLESAWEAVIRRQYVFQEPFPWGEAWNNFVIEVLPSMRWPAAFGFIAGAFGYLSSWARNKRNPHTVASFGVTRTFQNIRLFQALSVIDNVLVAAHKSIRSGIARAALRWPKSEKSEREARSVATELLQFVGLEGREESKARHLSYGHQRRLEIARGLATQPKILLLDEPAAGMNPKEAKDLMLLIQRIRDRGVTVVLIEHHMKVVMGISDRVVVLDYGVKIAEGTPDEIKRNEKVIEAYLGKESEC